MRKPSPTLLALAGATLLQACSTITPCAPPVPLIDLTLEQLSSIVVTSVTRSAESGALARLSLGARTRADGHS